MAFRLQSKKSWERFRRWASVILSRSFLSLAWTKIVGRVNRHGFHSATASSPSTSSTLISTATPSCVLSAAWRTSYLRTLTKTPRQTELLCKQSLSLQSQHQSLRQLPAKQSFLLTKTKAWLNNYRTWDVPSIFKSNSWDSRLTKCKPSPSQNKIYRRCSTSESSVKTSSRNWSKTF